MLENNYQTQLFDNRNPAHLAQTAALLAQGEIVAFGFNGIFVFLGGAEQSLAARRIAWLKQQPLDKPLAMVCDPDYLAEFVDLTAPAFHYHPFVALQQLQRLTYCLGLLLPAAKAGVPAYMQQNGNILNVWMSYPPHHPARHLQDLLRQSGIQALMASSVNRHGEPTYSDVEQVWQVFGGRISAIVNYDPRFVTPEQRQSSTLLDFTGPFPRLLRQGSVSVPVVQQQLQRCGLRPLQLPQRTQPSRVAWLSAYLSGWSNLFLTVKQRMAQANQK